MVANGRNSVDEHVRINGRDFGLSGCRESRCLGSGFSWRRGLKRILGGEG